MKRTPVLVLAGTALVSLATASAWAQLAVPPPTHPEPPPAIKLIEPGPAVPDWLAYNYDRERTGWNRGETTLSPKTVGKVQPLWNTQLTTASQALVLSTLTAPVVVAGVSTSDGTKDLVFSIGMDDVLSAVDANTGKIRLAEKLSQYDQAAAAAVDQLLQYRAGHAHHRQGQGRDLLHDQRRQPARRPPGRRQRGAGAHQDGAALQPQLEPQPGGQCDLHHHGAGLRRQSRTADGIWHRGGDGHLRSGPSIAVAILYRQRPSRRPVGRIGRGLGPTGRLCLDRRRSQQSRQRHLWRHGAGRAPACLGPERQLYADELALCLCA